MEQFMEWHLEAWLKKHVIEEERDETRRKIHALIADHPDLLSVERMASWTEIRNLAEVHCA